MRNSRFGSHAVRLGARVLGVTACLVAALAPISQGTSYAFDGLAYPFFVCSDGPPSGYYYLGMGQYGIEPTDGAWCFAQNSPGYNIDPTNQCNNNPDNCFVYATNGYPWRVWLHQDINWEGGGWAYCINPSASDVEIPAAYEDPANVYVSEEVTSSC
jgi:hypothetical protein